MPLTVNGISYSEYIKISEARKSKESSATKYHLRRKPKSSDDYSEVKLVIGEEEKEISDSSKYLLEQMITDDSDNQNTLKVVVEGEEKKLSEVSEYMLDMIIKEN